MNLITDEFELRPFEKVALPQSDKGKRIKQRDYLPFGKLPVVDQGQSDIGGYTDDEEMCFSGSLPVVIFGDHTRAVKLVNHPFAVGADGIKIFSPAADVLPKYLYYWMKSAPIENRGYGRHYQYLRKLSVRVPSLAKQQAIVDEIEKQFSRLDEAIVNLQRVKANLKRYKASVLKAAVEGRLVETKGGWRQSTLGEEGAIIGGLTKNQKRNDLPLKLPYLRVANVYANELRLDDIEYIGIAEKELDKLLVRKGDLLVVEGNGSPDQIGRVALWNDAIPNCVHQNHLIKVRFADAVLPEWGLIWMLSPICRHAIEQVSACTSGLHTLSVGKVSRLPINFPPRIEQIRIIAEVDRHLTMVRRVASEIDNNFHKCQALCHTVLKSILEK